MSAFFHIDPCHGGTADWAISDLSSAGLAVEDRDDQWGSALGLSVVGALGALAFRRLRPGYRHRRSGGR